MATAAAPSWASRRAVAPPIPPPPPVMAKTRPLQEWKSNDAMIIIGDNLIQEKELMSERKTAVQTLQMLLRAYRAREICNITKFSVNIPFGVGLLVHKDPECQTGVGGGAGFVVLSLLRDRPPEQPLSYFGIVFVFLPLGKDPPQQRCCTTYLQLYFKSMQAQCRSAMNSFHFTKSNFPQNGFQHVRNRQVCRLVRQRLVHHCDTGSITFGPRMDQQAVAIMAAEEIPHHQPRKTSGRVYHECIIHHAQRT